jgi:peroxiredoxin
MANLKKSFYNSPELVWHPNRWCAKHGIKDVIPATVGKYPDFLKYKGMTGW